MYTYSQLLLRNVIFGLLFSIALAAVATFLLQNLISEQQNSHKKTLFKITEATEITEENINNIVSQIKSSFDYATIEIKNEQGDVLYSNKQKLSIVEQWFTPKASASTNKSSNLTVTYQLNFAKEISFYFTLLIISFVLSMLVAIISGYFSLKRYGKIISEVGAQVKLDIEQIVHPKENEPKMQHDIIFELPEVQAALNTVKSHLSGHISDVSALQKDAYIEPLTKLENRTRFVKFFENNDQPVKFGALAITRCSELQTINQIHGYHEGDNYICNVAEIIKNASSKYKGAQTFRLNSSDFATILPNTTIKDAENFAVDLTDQFNHLQVKSELDSVAYTGLVAFSEDKPLGELLALADTGISVAQTKQINSWYAQTDADILANSSASYGNQNWRQEIDAVIENQRIKLLVQHIKPSSRNNRVYGEILARFMNINGEVLPTASFIAMAEKLDKIVAIDRMIVEEVMSEIAHKNMVDQHFGINLSARSIHDEHFLIWLERRLLRDPNIASNLIFEITEYGLQQNIKSSKRFVDMVHRVGARITVERFGVGLTSFKFFKDLKPDFIKMDSAYTRDIDEDKNNQYFLRLMVDLAHRLSITVLAESVETQEEKFTLEKLFIDGCQGFYIGKPEPI